MARKSFRKLIAVVTMGATLFTTTIASAADTTTKNSTALNSSSDSSDLLDGNAPGVLKVNVDDNGNVQYQNPVGKTALEVDAGKWGDKKYDANRTFSWNDVNMYFVMTDRFVNGDPSNDHSYGRGTDKDGKAVANYDTLTGNYHGGDLKGLTSKINDGYFDNLGTNAIWLTAPYEQIHGAMSADKFKHYAYAGYWTLDYTEMDKNMGTEEDLKTFVDTAHDHGIRVVFDVVMNHAGYPNPKDADEFKYGGLRDNWKDIYYGSDSSLSWWSDYDCEAKKNGDETKGMMLQNADWTNFWGTNWLRLTVDKDGTHRFGSYSPTGIEDTGDEKTYCSSGLPDFVTEGTTDPGLPVLYKNKWSADKMKSESDAIDKFCKDNGMQKCVKSYLCKWLSDWVRKYGVDGFRCDTAKHVGIDCWADLQKSCNKALKEWRTNNSDKECSKWTDDFWMTGEDYGRGLDMKGSGYFTSGAFKSMINFNFQGNEGKTGSALEGTYSSYATAIDGGDSFNMLSYESSHDKELGARSANTGTALLLCPGGTQTFYGDETGRQNDSSPKGQSCRSNMNWDSVNQTMLSNWQKVGQFRSEHIAVGAGKHTKLSDSPYTFSRTYEKGDVKDKVVVSLPGTGGEQTIDCGDTFADGTTVIDYYTGNDYDVSGGKVTVEADKSGVVLLSEGKPSTKASVSASAEKATNGSYYDDTLDVTLNVKKATSGTYSINGGEEQTYKDGDKITIGKDAAKGDVTRIQLKATGDNDTSKEAITKEYDYTKSEKATESGSTATGLTIHAKNTTWADKTKMNIWAYKSTTENITKAQKWPGDPMTADKDGWFTINYPDAKDSYSIILSNLPDRSVPDGQNDAPQTGEAWYLDGKWYSSNPETLSITSFKADKFKVAKGEEVNLTASATGSSVKYEFFDGDKSIKQSDDGKATWTPAEDGTYKIKVVAKDSSDKTVSETMTYVVGKGGEIVNPPANEFKIKSLKSDKDTMKTGETATITAETENADGDVSYAFKAEDGEKQDYSDSDKFEFKPQKDGTYKITVTAKDSKGTEVTDSITIAVGNNVDPPIEKQLSFKSLESDKSAITVGQSAIITAETENATGNVSYAFKASDEEKQDYSDKNQFEFKPAKAGDYTVTVTAKDNNGKEITKDIKITANEAGDNKENPVQIETFTTDAEAPQKVGTSITLKATSKDGVGEVTYTFYVDGQKVQSGKSNQYKWTPNEAKDYDLKVVATDKSEKQSTENSKTMKYTISKDVVAQDFKVNIKPDKEKATLGDTVVFTLSTENADDDVTYEVTIDGEKQTVNNGKVTWTPKQEGKYNIQVVAKCGDKDAKAAISNYEVASKSENPNDPKEGDSKNAVALGVLGTMALGYVAINRKKKNA